MTGPKMWPAILPSTVRLDPLRSGEVVVYDALKKALPGKWTVFYSRPWLGLNHLGGERDGECDFIVAHPERGVLAVEVKGGGITYDPMTDSWLSRDRYGIRHRIKNPVDQARRAKHELMKKARASKGWPTGSICFRHGVIFPDAETPPGDLGADRPKELFCCRAELRKGLLFWIESRLAQGVDEQGPGTNGILALEKLLAAPISLPMSLGFVIADDEQAIASLTPQQFHILNLIADLPRVAAGGGAGTGKTILACEDARRFAEKGFRTLLTCRGSRLAEHLRSRMVGTGVIVLSFEDLCIQIGKPASLQVRSISAQNFAESDGPELLIQTVESNPRLKFDGIFVDEAQDFISHWWVALDALLKDVEHARMHVFFDSNQKLYGLVSTQLKSFSFSTIPLTRNMRNTQNIHAAASVHYNGQTIYADGPKGVEIEFQVCAENAIVRTVRDVVRRLCGHDAIPPTEIAVLAPDSSSLSTIRASGIADGIVLDTIAEFKGLERPVVVVAATRAIADQDELAYVALSRARTHLVLVGDRLVLSWLAPDAHTS